MEINYKFIQHERSQDAPFIGALISGTTCKLNCSKCFNHDIRKMDTMVNSAETIIKLVKDNPLNEGIILAGLEWSEQPLELLELCKEAVKENLQIIIYTGCELEHFHRRIGKACCEKTGKYEEISKNILTDEDAGIYGSIGRMVLDTTIPYTYYIKTGKYDKDCLVDDNIQFGVKLASANQKIYKIEGIIIDESH